MPIPASKSSSLVDLVATGDHTDDWQQQKTLIDRAYLQDMVAHPLVDVGRAVTRSMPSTLLKIAAGPCHALAVFNNCVMVFGLYPRTSTSTASTTFGGLDHLRHRLRLRQAPPRRPRVLRFVGEQNIKFLWMYSCTYPSS